MALRFLTAGESHGKALVAIVEGLPAGLSVVAEQVDQELARRMMGYGRGARMKIERDRIEWLSGVRAGETLGTPVAMLIHNRDWANWEEVMAAEGDAWRCQTASPHEAATRPRRPGRSTEVRSTGRPRHSGAGQCARNRRSGGRWRTRPPPAGRVRVEIGSHIVSLGGIQVPPVASLPVPLNPAADNSEIRVLDRTIEAEIIRRIDQAKKDGDTLGGEAQVVVRGLPVGPGKPRALGPEAGWSPRRRVDVHSSGQGSRDWNGVRGSPPPGFSGA